MKNSKILSIRLCLPVEDIISNINSNITNVLTYKIKPFDEVFYFHQGILVKNNENYKENRYSFTQNLSEKDLIWFYKLKPFFIKTIENDFNLIIY